MYFYSFVRRQAEDSRVEDDKGGELHRVTGLELKNLTAHQELPIIGTTDMLLAMRRALSVFAHAALINYRPDSGLNRLLQPEGKQ